MNSKLNRIVFFSALALALALLVPYEQYWRRVEHWPASHGSESLGIWADQRSRVNDLDSTDVLILGSSRAHFDININLWDSLTGRSPLQLAYPGSSPYFPLEDIVNNTNFNGLLVIGVSPGLFFSVKDSWGAGRGKALVDHYQERTYAEVFSHRLYVLIDPHFSYLQDELTLKSLLQRKIFPNRDSVEHPVIWPPMVRMDKYRNIRMIPEMETDSVLQQKQKDIWFNPNPKNRDRDSIDVIMNHYVSLAKKFGERGGKVVFIRAPISGFYVDTEYELYPRAEYWDRLIRECECRGYHYADHPKSRKMIPPEWSHLNRKDSDAYTRILIELLSKDQLL